MVAECSETKEARDGVMARCKKLLRPIRRDECACLELDNWWLAVFDRCE